KYRTDSTMHRSGKGKCLFQPDLTQIAEWQIWMPQQRSSNIFPKILVVNTTDSQSESEASPVKRPRLLDGSNDRPEETSRSKQKSRRRCFQCQTKLELVQQELGSCRCGYVFCMLHRLPEQHDCTFDHMGRGREEAIMKMVKLDRKVGRSCQRIGEGCS
uniref:Zinc finger AN1-type containing 3 n=1 Tax=Accipiter nisus TaxID=211598 RepID=A0A8B9NPB6_9AVES